MIEQGFIKKNFVGQEGFQWWIGQIANEEKWKANMPSSPQNNNETIQGFGERYKVRIMGYHTASMTDLPDDDLPWAQVMYPVTAGGGGRNSYGNANLTQGCFVFGFFMDGKAAQMPIIMGCLGYNEYQAVMKNVPDAQFIPFSGYTENYDQGKVATIATRVDSDQGTVARQVGLQTGAPLVDAWSEGVAATANIKDMASFVAVDMETTDPTPDTSECEPMPVGKLQRQLQNILQEVEKVRRAQTDYRYAVTRASGNEEAKVSALIKKAAKFVAGSMKYVYGEIEKSILKSVNSGVQQMQNLLMPAEQHELKTTVDGINDVISCLFKRMIGGLYNMAFNFLNQMLTRAVNITRCFVDNFIGQILGRAMGTIDGIVQGALGGLNGVMALGAGLSGAIPTIPNISLNVTSLIGDVLSFLTCEENPQCSEVKDFNILSGVGSLASTDVASILGTMGSVAAQAAADVAGQVAAGVGIPVPSASDLDNLGSLVNFSSVSSSTCMDGSNAGTDPRSCGPPLVSFLGGGFTGAPPVGNALISAAGSVLGVDLNSYGLSVSSSLQISINDDCGSGQGAVVTPVFGPVQTYQATETNINQPPPTNPDVWDQIPSTGIGTIGAWSPTTTYEPGDITQVPVGNPGTGAGTVAAATTDGSAPTTGVVAVNVVQGGTGYLSSPNGSTGGDGRTWARPDDTSIVRNSLDGESDGRDGLREIPRAPGNNMCVTAGAQVLLPPGTSVILEPSGEEILGGAPRTVTTTGCFTTPSLPTDTTARGGYPSGDGSYPVILSMDVINIRNPGVRYSPDDEVVISPDNGATAQLEVNDMGSITNVRVTSPGEGFQETPQVYVKSGTGFNAELNPRFRIDRVGDVEVEEPSVQDNIIEVIDCVGKIPTSLYAPCKNCTDTSMVW